MWKILPVLSLFLLAGCGVAPFSTAVMSNLAMGGATAVSYSVVGQSPMDYAISKFRGQNCDIRNPKKYDGLYCVNGKYEIVEPTVYCYRSLGDADCSDRLDPYANRNQPIVRNQPYTQAAAAASLPPSSAMPPIPAPTALQPAAVPAVARQAPAAPAKPAALTPADAALEGS